VEDALGKGTFLFFYLFCGFVAALAQTASSPDSMIPNIGASGAIAGVMGAYFVLWPGSKVLTLLSLGFFWILREISAGWVLLFWIALQAAMAYFSMGGEATGGVAYFAHIGGFLAGILLVILLGGPSLGEKQRRAALKK
jgi:membrane associated rhomboid family serine protease